MVRFVLGGVYRICHTVALTAPHFGGETKEWKTSSVSDALAMGDSQGVSKPFAGV